MRQIVYIMIGVALLMAGQSCGRPGGRDRGGKPRITVTIEPLRYFTEAIAGDCFAVESMVPKGSSPEMYDPSPRQLVALSRSKAYFRVGYVDFEQVWMERLAENAPDMQVFDLSEGVPLIRATEPHGHHGSGVEPHIWMSAENALAISANIAAALCRLDAVHAPFYRHRLDSLSQVIRGTDAAIRGMLASAPRSFMIYHPALSYFARDYGLRQYALEESGKEPSPSYLKDLVDVCRREDIRVVFVQPEFDVRNARVVAEEAKARLVQVNPLAYDWRQEMLSVARALQEAGIRNEEKE